MLPVESILYFSAALIPLCFRHGCHPFIVLYTKLDLAIGAQLGHSGFDAFGCGSYFHQLHHERFESNYGEPMVPLDWLFGTYDDGRPKPRCAAKSN
jgi:sterol desaturase/sphingolipid hydroxylase (fatty acid hydroxylase superfamily)